MKEKIEQWYNRLPEYERDLPIIFHEGHYYTPHEIIAEVRAQSYTGEILQRLIEQRELSDMWTLAKERLLIRVRRYRPTYHIMTPEGPKTIGADELISHIEREDSIGKYFIRGEMSRIKYLLRNV